MDLSDCNICLQRSFGFTTDKRFILFCVNVLSEIYTNIMACRLVKSMLGKELDSSYVNEPGLTGDRT
jgi:hypothetical protein